MIHAQEVHLARYDVSTRRGSAGRARWEPGASARWEPGASARWEPGASARWEPGASARCKAVPTLGSAGTEPALARVLSRLTRIAPIRS